MADEDLYKKAVFKVQFLMEKVFYLIVEFVEKFSALKTILIYYSLVIVIAYTFNDLSMFMRQTIYFFSKNAKNERFAFL
jgi:hypothetical protein